MNDWQFWEIFSKETSGKHHLVVGGGGQVEVPQEPPELHGRGVVLGQTGEVVVRASQEFPQLV